MVLTPGTYKLPHGVSIGASNVIVDMNGATFVGSNYTGVGVTSIGHDSISVVNGSISGYYYAIKVVQAADVGLKYLNTSLNWRDPAADHLPTPPWLNINVVPADYGDRTNLGGGVSWKSCRRYLQLLVTQFRLGLIVLLLNQTDLARECDAC